MKKIAAIVADHVRPCCGSARPSWPWFSRRADAKRSTSSGQDPNSRKCSSSASDFVVSCCVRSANSIRSCTRPSTRFAISAAAATEFRSFAQARETRFSASTSANVRCCGSSSLIEDQFLAKGLSDRSGFRPAARIRRWPTLFPASRYADVRIECISHDVVMRRSECRVKSETITRGEKTVITGREQARKVELQAFRIATSFGEQSGEQKCPNEVTSPHLGAYVSICKLLRRLKR